jgi:peptidoglycan/xylan/chitin deacetylase (PgdA/CDA1 family)
MKARTRRTSRTLPLDQAHGRSLSALALVFALGVVGLYCAQAIPPRLVAPPAGHDVSAKEAPLLQPSQKRDGIPRGLGYMPPRSKPPKGKGASSLEGLRSLGVLRGYSMPPDRLVFLPDGEAQFVPSSPMPSGPHKGLAVWRGDSTRHRVALTFDDGYGGTGGLVDLLTKLRVPATIFPVGGAVPGNRTALREASERGFEIANHTATHPTCTKIPNDAIVREVKACDETVARATGRGTAAYFRPPGGATDWRVNQVMGDMGYVVVLWNHDTLDWHPATTLEQVISRATDGIQDGDIILMHSQGRHTLEALPTIVKVLREKGFELTTVSGVL